MYFCLYFISFFGVLLSKGDLAHAQPEKIEAFVGGHAMLPCSLKNPASDHVPTVEWSKEGLNDSIVFLYRDGCETFGMKNVDFEFRVSLFMKEVKNGNVSLRISNLRLSDAGTYECLIIQRDKTRQTTRVELVVAAVFDLKLSVVFEEKEVVAVTCDASCRLPPPIIIIQDDKGNDVTDKEPSQQQDVRGCYATRQTFSMQEGNRRVVCGVKQPQTDINRTAEMLLSNKASCKGSNIIAISCAVGGTSFFWIAILLVWRKYHKIEKKLNRKKSLDSTSISVDSLSLLTQSSESNTQNSLIENQQNEVTDLRSISSRKHEIICELQEEMRSLGDVYHHEKPTTVQSFSESFQDFPGSSKQSLYLDSVTSNNVADRNLMKKSSKQSKDVQQRQINNSTLCRVSKRTQGHSSTSEWITQSGSRLAAGGNQKRNAHSDPLIDPDHSVSLVYRRYSSWPSPHSHSSNRYSLLANLPEQ
ncbi:uncharacterized protein V3H82_013467 [Fundulus diaphanus]